MGYELLLAKNITGISAVILFLVASFVCIKSFWLRNKSLSKRNIAILFFVLVIAIWGYSDAFHQYAKWRIYEEIGGVNYFRSSDEVGEDLYLYLNEVVISDTGNSLQPLGAIVMSTLYIIAAQLSGYLIKLFRSLSCTD